LFVCFFKAGNVESFINVSSLQLAIALLQPVCWQECLVWWIGKLGSNEDEFGQLQRTDDQDWVDVVKRRKCEQLGLGN
jgi:hypothetical protein